VPHCLCSLTFAANEDTAIPEENFAYIQDPLPSLPNEEPHIYFKDLKLLAEPADADQEEDHFGQHEVPKQDSFSDDLSSPTGFPEVVSTTRAGVECHLLHQHFTFVTQTRLH
jgi:hypothetical protein